MNIFHMKISQITVRSYNLYIKTHDSESRGQEEPATTEWVIYKDHHEKTR